MAASKFRASFHKMENKKEKKNSKNEIKERNPKDFHQIDSCYFEILHPQVKIHANSKPNPNFK